jgi:Mrp family chromosome partitioning ATPase
LVDEKQVIEALKPVQDPELGRSIVDLGMVRSVRIQGANVEVTLALTTLGCPLKDRISGDVKQAASGLPGVKRVDVRLEEMTAEERSRAMGPQPNVVLDLPASKHDVRHVVAVMSGKGGVGKSFVTSMLAVSLQRRGLKVGVLDADITGPSIPRMFGVSGPVMQSAEGMLPVESRTGIPIMSVNLLLPHEDDAVIWRGPLIAGIIKQFWSEVAWGELDYLLVDLPPGTADAPLTVMQTIPLNGVVIVTSPQELAAVVVRKAAQMARQLSVPILGIVENMAYAECPRCGDHYEVFGPSRAAELAATLEAPLLARLPLDPQVAVLCDQGEVESYHSAALDDAAEAILARMPEQATQPVFAAERGST